MSKNLGKLFLAVILASVVILFLMLFVDILFPNEAEARTDKDLLSLGGQYLVVNMNGNSMTATQLTAGFCHGEVLTPWRGVICGAINGGPATVGTGGSSPDLKPAIGAEVSLRFYLLPYTHLVLGAEGQWFPKVSDNGANALALGPDLGLGIDIPLARGTALAIEGKWFIAKPLSWDIGEVSWTNNCRISVSAIFPLHY